MRLTDPSATARIGIARRDITPPAGIYNRAWGAARHDTAAGVHRPLTVTAAAFRPTDATADAGNATTLVLVAVDAGWWQLNADEWFLRGALLERFGLDPARVMVAFAHTHAGPSICRADADKPGGEFIAGYLQRLRDAVVEAVDEAIRAAVPATLSWTYGRCNLATNRDMPEPATAGASSPRVVCGFNPDNPADDTLLVGRITENAGGRIMGVIVNYACHPTTLAWENALISPDYVGAMREVVESNIAARGDNAGGPYCMFLQGSSGELSPREQYVGDVTIADRNGRWLGYAVLATLESMLPPRTALEFAGVVESGAPLATWKRVPCEPSTTLAATTIDVPLPLKPLASEEEIEREAAACADRVMAERLRRKLRVRASVGTDSASAQTAWLWRIGDALLVGQPNETYSAFQQDLRRAFPEACVAVMNLVNGCVGYISPADLHDLDIYQVWQSPFDRDALRVLTAACTQAMQSLH